MRTEQSIQAHSRELLIQAYHTTLMNIDPPYLVLINLSPPDYVRSRASHTQAVKLADLGLLLNFLK